MIATRTGVEMIPSALPRFTKYQRVTRVGGRTTAMAIAGPSSAPKAIRYRG
jgi:hypothetical protein